MSNSNVCVVRIMPMSMWQAWDEHEHKVGKWGILNVPKNKWIAGPYVTQSDAINALADMDGAEFTLEWVCA